MESDGKPGGLSNPAFLPDDEVRGYPPPYSKGSTPGLDGTEVIAKCDAAANTDKSDSSTLIFGLRKSQFLLLVALCFSNFLSLGCSSLHAPFYPKVVGDLMICSKEFYRKALVQI